MDLTCDRTRFHIRSLPAEDFPRFPEAPDSNWLVLLTGLFAALVPTTEFAVSHDASRYTLTGLSLRATACDVRITSCDGHRLATTAFPHANGTTPSMPSSPPADLITAAGLTCTLGGEVEFAFTANQDHLILRQPAFLIATRLIDGTYPDIEQVIPKQTEHLSRSPARPSRRP